MRALNEELLVGNTCFGCAPDSAEGLRIRVFHDGDRTDRLVGTFEPRPTMAGFPSIVHGGLQFTALDCMAAWCIFALRARGVAVVPLTKSASMRYLRPARLGPPLSLAAEIVGEPATPKAPLLIKARVLDAAGGVLSEADFEYVMLPQDRFKRAIGIDVMPDSYRRHFGEI